MRYFSLFAAPLLFAGSAYSALPPLWQGIEEVKMIVEDKRLGDYLQSGEVLKEIERTDSGWVIITNKSKLPVFVKYEDSNQPGPRHFKLEFGPKKDKDQKDNKDSREFRKSKKDHDD